MRLRRALHLLLVVLGFLCLGSLPGAARHAVCLGNDTITPAMRAHIDSLWQRNDSIHALARVRLDSMRTADSLLARAAFLTDSMLQAQRTQPKARVQFTPDPQRALWMALVIPGGGQIYNRKHWKLPIIYGGFLGCTYALLWNQQMYTDYRQAYADIMDDDPKTASYEKMLPLGYSIAGREEQFKNIFKHKRDFYRRYRDMSIFAFGAVYLLSVVDAYVDAHLATFDISDDLSMQVRPAVINQQYALQRGQSAFGLQCQFNIKR